MVIYRSSDSMSRCDANSYSSIYDVRRRPAAKQESVKEASATQPIHKDTIEISKDKLKKEALKRLRHTTDSVIAQSGFMRVGRFLFLAIALPPYFALYGLPKWLLVEALPTFISVILSFTKPLQVYLKKQVDAGKKQVQEVVQFIRTLVTTLLRPFIHLSGQIQQYFRKWRLDVGGYFNTIQSKLGGVIRFPRIQLQFGIKKRIQNQFSKVRDKWSQKREELKEGVQLAIGWIKARPEAVLEWGKLQWQRLIEQGSAKHHQLKSRLEPAQKFAQRLTEWSAEQMNRLGRLLSKPFVPMVKLYKEQWIPLWHSISNPCKALWNKARDFFQNKHQRTLAFIGEKHALIRKKSYALFLDKIAAHRSIDKLPRYIQNLLRSFLAHCIVRGCCERILGAYTFLMGAILKLIEVCLRAIGKATQFIGEILTLIKAMTCNARKAFISLLRIVGYTIRTYSFYALYYSLLALTITAIVTVWSIHYLASYTNSLFLNLKSFF